MQNRCRNRNNILICLFIVCHQGGDNYLIGRSNNNSVDLNRDFPDLDRLIYADEEEHALRNNHLMDQIRHLDHPVRSSF